MATRRLLYREEELQVSSYLHHHSIVNLDHHFHLHAYAFHAAVAIASQRSDQGSSRPIRPMHEQCPHALLID
jgi:hypothetical protein